MPTKRWSPKSTVWTIPINRQSPKSVVWTIPINRQSPKAIAWTIPFSRQAPKSIADTIVYWNRNCPGCAKIYPRTGQPCQGRGTADDRRLDWQDLFIPGSPCMRVPRYTIDTYDSAFHNPGIWSVLTRFCVWRCQQRNFCAGRYTAVCVV